MTSSTTETDPKPPATGSALRSDLAARLRDEGAHDLADKLDRCAETMRITCTCCGLTKEIETRCKQRWCPVCSVRLSLTRIARFETAAARTQWPLMVTLTCKNTEHAEAAAPTITKAFTKFRRTRFWTRTVKGGVASFECTNRGNHWHPHLHILCDCRWLALHTKEPRRTDSTDETRRKLRSAQRELSQQWAAALGQTTAIVHVRRAFGDSLKEALKYNLKPTDLLQCKNKIAPLLRALKGKRLVIPFGSYYDLGEQWKIDDSEKKAAAACDKCGTTKSFLPDAVIAIMRSAKFSKHHGTRSAA